MRSFTPQDMHIWNNHTNEVFLRSYLQMNRLDDRQFTFLSSPKNLLGQRNKLTQFDTEIYHNKNSLHSILKHLFTSSWIIKLSYKTEVMMLVLQRNQMHIIFGRGKFISCTIPTSSLEVHLFVRVNWSVKCLRKVFSWQSC